MVDIREFYVKDGKQMPGRKACLQEINGFIFTRILDLTSYLSSPLLHLLEDLYCGIFNGHLESCVALCLVEYSSSASFHERRSTFGECSSSSKHNVATYRGLQRRALNVKEPSCVNTNAETDTEKGQTHGGMPLVFGGYSNSCMGLQVSNSSE